MTAANAQPNAMQENPQLARRNRTILWLGVILVTLVTLILIPAQVFAGENPGEGGGSGMSQLCAQNGSASACLPSGRWGSFVGSIDGRLEPGPLGVISNLFNNIQQTTRTILPNMILMVTQVCWSSALALSDFAVNFAPLSEMMKQADKGIGAVVDNIMAGGIPGMLVFLAVLGWVGAAAFQIGTQRNAIKRGIATVLCLSAVVVMGGAAKADAGADSPSPGSPWWVVSAVDDTINKLTVGLDMDGINDDNPNFMAANVKGKDGFPTCQSYLYWMHQQYKGVAEGSMAEQRGEKSSAVTSSINRLWEETALRNWVTMQWGNPQQGPNTSQEVANNAQVAYCHVLEAQAGTNVTTQAELTSRQLELQNPIDGNTARYLFTTDGWIDPWNSKVNTHDDALDRGQSVYRTRMAVFWETCTATPSNSTPRPGWTELISGLGAAKEIKNSAQSVRADSSDSRLNYVWGMQSFKGNPSTACTQVLNNQVFRHGHIPTAQEVKNAQEGKIEDSDPLAVTVSDYGDAATLGWTFDVPNLDATYREANANGNFNPANDNAARGVKNTLDVFYNNSNVDQLGALGTMLGSFVNMIVWGLLSLVLIISKVMLGVMGIFLIAAFLVQAFPFGDAPTKTLKNWIKTTCNMSMTGTLISFIGTLATFICGIVLSATSNATNGFLYSLVAGLSPLFAIAAISLFCTQIMKIGNPFSFKAMMKAAGGSALVSGISMLGMNKAKGMLTNGLHNLRPNRRAATRLTSKDSQGAGATESANILNKAATEQTALTNTGAAAAGTAATGDGAPTLKERIQNGLDETFDGVRDKTGKAWSAHREKLDSALDRHNVLYQSDMDHYMQKGMDPTKAAERAQTLKNIRDFRSKATHGVGQAARALSTGAAFTAAAIKSQPLRRVVRAGIQKGMPIAKTAAKVGVGALAMSNPITAPLGLAAFAAAANPLNRNTRATVGTAFAATKAGASLAGRGVVGASNKLFNSLSTARDQAINQRDPKTGKLVNNSAYTRAIATSGYAISNAVAPITAKAKAAGSAMRDFASRTEKSIEKDGLSKTVDNFMSKGVSDRTPRSTSADGSPVERAKSTPAVRAGNTPAVTPPVAPAPEVKNAHHSEPISTKAPELTPSVQIEPGDATSEAHVPATAWAGAEEDWNSANDQRISQQVEDKFYSDRYETRKKNVMKMLVHDQGMPEAQASKLAADSADKGAEDDVRAYKNSPQFKTDVRRAQIEDQTQQEFRGRVYQEAYDKSYSEFVQREGMKDDKASSLAQEQASKQADASLGAWIQTPDYQQTVRRQISRNEDK